MKIRRREFIKLLGGTTTFSLAYGYGLFSSLDGIPNAEAVLPPLEDVSLRPPKETWVPSVCRQCRGGCGILVRVYGKRAVKIDGNPLHPINRGRLCARGQAGLQVLYDPDRIQGPLARDGERGSGKWKAISWKEAVSTLTDKLKTLRTGKKPESLVMLSDGGQGLSAAITERFMKSFGSPNLIHCQDNRPKGSIPAIELMQGPAAGITYDIENTSYILSFNSSLLEDHWSPVQLYQAYGKFRRGREAVRGKLVQIEPRLSVTGAKADHWIPIRPGSEGVLAMGIASVLIIEKRYNENFLRERTFGFEDWTDDKGKLHPGYKTLIIQEYPLEKVEKLTGVPRDAIIGVAREFANLQPAIAIGNDASWIGNPGLYNRMAVHALNALKGNIQQSGGIRSVAQTPDLSLGPLPHDPVATQGLQRPRIDGAGNGRYAFARDLPENLSDRILNKQPYGVEALLLHHANPFYYSTEPDQFMAALKEVPTIVSFSSFMDDTTQYADLILPDSVYLEKWNLDSTYTLKGNPVVNLSRPVVAPTYDTRDTIEVLREVATGLGGPIGRALSSTKTEDLIQSSAKKLYSGSRGETFGAPLEELWTKLLEQSGWKIRHKVNFDTFWSELLQRGGWWDPVYYPYEWQRVFSTPSGRFEFYSLAVKHYLQGLEGMERDVALQAMPEPVDMEREDAGCLPHGDPGKTEGNQNLYNLEINPYVVAVLHDLQSTNLPWLQDITGFHLYQSWHTWAEIHPETAHRMKIKSGDWVTVESPVGKIKAKARLYEGAMPSVINIPVGLGHTSGGRWTSGIGENTLALLRTQREPITGRIRFHRVRARLILEHE
jgi:anaerobic selenocysteine-containing dehydrogenase